MANTKKYLAHLLQNTDITPACSEEERAAAEIIEKVFENHGFTPEVQEFSAGGSAKIVQAGLGIAVFLGAVLMGIGGVVGIIGLLLALAAAVLFVMERSGRPVLSNLGAGGLSQNVIAYHKASGPLASPRNRPVVVVAHYDSPRADLLSQEPYAAYRPLLTKLLPFAMLAPAIIAIVRLLPLPDAAKVVLWLLAIVAALIPLANAVAIIANRFVLPYTSGAVSNKSSVAAMLGVMDAVAPYELGEEFPHDTPADEYFADQQRVLEEALAAAEAAAATEVAYPHELENLDEEDVDAVAEGEEDAAAAAELSDDVADETSGSTGLIFAAGEDAVEIDAVDEIDDGLGSTVAMDASEIAESAASATSVVEDTAAEPASEDEPEGTSDEPAGEEFEKGEESPEASDEPSDEAPDVPAQEELDFSEVSEDEVEAEPEDEPEYTDGFRVNAEGNVRFGASAIRSLGMLAPTCSIVYEDEEPEEEDELTAFEVRPMADDAYSDEFAYEDESFDGDEPLDASEPMYAEDYEESEQADDETIDVEPEYEEETEYEEGVEEAEEEAADSDKLVVEGEWSAIDEVEEPEAEETADADLDEQPTDLGETQAYAAVADEVEDPSHTIAMPAQKGDTLDSLMAEISSPYSRPVQNQRVINVPSTADAPVPRTPQAANRSSLFDLPDPSAAPIDPFASEAPRPASPSDEAAAEARNAFTVISAPVPAATPDPDMISDRVDVIAAPAPQAEKPRRGLSRLFGRKKKNDDSMSGWLGVDEDFDAKRTGGDIGSWDNFDDDDGWKGGAVGAPGATEDELREAVTDMGDDELLGHDIWFVATGASENGNAGIKAFLNTHRDKLRGVFLINLESVGAGQLAMLATEGEQRVLKGDKRIMKLISRVSEDFHHEIGSVDMPYVTTDAHAAMSMSLRSLTVAGVDATGFALSHTEQDQPFNVDPENVALVSDVVTEVIRRS